MHYLYKNDTSWYICVKNTKHQLLQLGLVVHPDHLRQKDPKFKTSLE